MQKVLVNLSRSPNEKLVFRNLVNSTKEKPSPSANLSQDTQSADDLNDVAEEHTELGGNLPYSGNSIKKESILFTEGLNNEEESETLSQQLLSSLIECDDSLKIGRAHV